MSMSINPEHSITQLMSIVESDKRSEIRLNANGGNSILLVCPPVLEFQFIEKLMELLPAQVYQLIDLNKLLNEFIEAHQADLPEMFDLLRGSIHQIFKAPSGESGPDLFQLILSAIKQSIDDNKVPVIIHSGALYGSGIDNIHLMESELVMRSKLPLIILYPATQDGNQLMFLSTRPASKYRCMIVK